MVCQTEASTGRMCITLEIKHCTEQGYSLCLKDKTRSVKIDLTGHRGVSLPIFLH